MECLRCRASNRDGRRFCGECGAPLTVACTTCGFANEAAERFCGGCGRPLGESSEAGAAPQPGQGERRQITVLFADVVGFTSLSERLDPEIVHEIMDGCFALLAREVGRYGGRVNAFTGDGVMALFGAPLAEEDHAVRALHAALAIQEALPAYDDEVQRRFGVEFRIRVGVNTGLVLAGAMGDGESVEYTALGDTINLAARLESAARPGGVLAGESTHRAAGEAFRWQPVGPLQLKGRSEPVAAWEPVAASEGQSRFEALAQRGLTNFVGRRAELDALLAAWHRAAAGEGQIISVVGEAGLGKSRLVHEFKTEMAKREASLFEGSCFTYGEAISYLPFLEILRGLLGIDPTTPPDDIGSMLHARLAVAGLEGCAPYLLHLLGLDPGDDLLGRQSPATVRQRTVEALRDLILTGAADHPMALVVEDVHWIDKASEEVLSVVVEAMADRPLLVMLVYRPEYLHAWGEVAYHAELCLDRLGGASSAAMVRAILSKSYAKNVSLEPLSAEDSRSMVRQLLATAAVPPEVERLVETHTDGNPLFIEELIRDLVESGHLVGHDDGYLLTQPAEALAHPTTVQGVLLARIDRLNPDLRGLLQIASVLGRVFSHRLLGALANPKGGLDRALLQLEDLDFVYQSALAPERQYSFKHVLAQEAVYRTLVRSRREAYHEQVGQAIEALYGEPLDEWVEVLAHHYTRSGNDEKAFEYLERANRKAARANALLEAVAYFDEASALLDRMPDTPANRHRRVTLVTDQFLVYFMLYRNAEYLEMARRYEPMAVEVDDRPVLGVFYKNIAHCQWLFGQWEDGLRTAHQAAALCEAAGNFAGVGMACNMIEWTHLVLGDFDEALVWEAKALAAYEEDLDLNYCVFARCGAAWAHAQRGQWQAALDECREALELASEYGDDGLASFAYTLRSLTFLYQGSNDAFLENAEIAMARAPTPAEESWAQSHLGLAWCRTGQVDRGIEVLTALSSLFSQAHLVLGQVWNASYLGESYWRAGRLAEANETLQGLVDQAGQSGMRFYLGAAHRLLGEVTRQADPSDNGRRRSAAHFQQSIAVLAEIGAENELALAYAGYGRLCRDGGDQGEARRYLTLALEIFEGLGTLTEPDQVRKDIAGLS